MIDLKDYKIELDLSELFKQLSTEKKLEFIHALAIEDDIIKEVTDYICNDSRSGAWTSASSTLRQEVLERIEKKQIEELATTGPLYGWRAWSAIIEKLKDIQTQKQVYWALYHDEIFRERVGWDFVDKFFKRHGIESNYTTKQANADIEEVKRLIKDGFSMMLKYGKL